MNLSENIAEADDDGGGRAPSFATPQRQQKPIIPIKRSRKMDLHTLSVAG